MINKYGGKMPDAIGIPEEMLRQAATQRGLQDQHRLRPAPGHDRHDPQVLRRESEPLRSAPVPRTGPHSDQGDGCPQDQECSWLRRQSLIYIIAIPGKREGIAAAIPFFIPGLKLYFGDRDFEMR